MKTLIFNKHWLITATFWIILEIAFWTQMIRDYPLIFATYVSFVIMIGSMISAHTLSDFLLPKAMATGKMKIFAIQCTMISLLLASVLSGAAVSCYWLFLHGTKYDSMGRMLAYSNFWLKLGSAIPSAILINATACGLRFYQEHGKIEKNHALLQQAHLEAQLRILQDQINPHLMFNVLNHIHILMQKNVELASVLLVKFSDILRYQLYECNRESVLLEREVQYLKDLVAVEKIRWGEELKVVCIWNIQDGKKDIVPLLLVPFVENAFKHVSRLPMEKGYVTLILKQENNELIFTMENSSSVQQPRKGTSHGLGLENVRKRLGLLYPQQHELSIEKTNSLFKVALIIQLHSKK
ncbi:sensor histidine kinase YesM [Pedobacter cryoconitis]|uniref:Sensor histidine kinase YesM n=1 Tax=Pedobacter cryoconitis TaxID=188932 RepID=A0A7W8ZN71_9SPHI|nr:histidine kinase [Pedobacter cryoconitis]MBB5636945.1 sensor histidine kinase YesM [Pedobacter cryoconitis]MBB6271346.1 sensor histidine kinase YesM [Pedobacter cryoconitis]